MNKKDQSRYASWMYRIIRPFAGVGLRLFYKKIYLSNLDNLPKKGPVIIAANHPTAFLEPCILACFQSRPLHYLVRGDFFKKPIYAFLLKSLHMLPIYRMRDGGYEKVKTNFSTFQQCFDALKAQKAIMILAEGSCIHEKRLRPIRKGTARIALGTLEKYPDMSIPIVPVGVNYTFAERARERVMIDFGEPIMVHNYKELFEKNNQKAINQLTKDLRKALEERVVSIEQKDDDELCEQLFALDRSERKEPAGNLIKNDDSYLLAEKQICDWVNQLPGTEKEILKEKANHYFTSLEQLDVRDEEVVKTNQTTNILGIILGFFPAAIGYLGHLLVRFPSERIALLVKRIEFFSPVRWASYSLLGVVFYLGISIYGIVSGYWPFVVLLALLGWWTVQYADYYKKWKYEKKYHGLSDLEKERLSKERMQLKNSISVFQTTQAKV